MTDATDMVVPAKTLRKFSRKYLSLIAWAKEPRVSILILKAPAESILKELGSDKIAKAHSHDTLATNSL